MRDFGHFDFIGFPSQGFAAQNSASIWPRGARTPYSICNVPYLASDARWWHSAKYGTLPTQATLPAQARTPTYLCSISNYLSRLLRPYEFQDAKTVLVLRFVYDWQQTSLHTSPNFRDSLTHAQQIGDPGQRCGIFPIEWLDATQAFSTYRSSLQGDNQPYGPFNPPDMLRSRPRESAPSLPSQWPSSQRRESRFGFVGNRVGHRIAANP